MSDQMLDKEQITDSAAEQLDGIPLATRPQQGAFLDVDKGGSPVRRTRVVMLLMPPLSRRGVRLPAFLKETIGWGVPVAIIAGFLFLHIYLDRMLTEPFSRFVIALTILVEIGLICFWDFYWYRS